MKIYQLRSNKPNSHYKSITVVAVNEKAALNIHPNSEEGVYQYYEQSKTWWLVRKEGLKEPEQDDTWTPKEDIEVTELGDCDVYLADRILGYKLR